MTITISHSHLTLEWHERGHAHKLDDCIETFLPPRDACADHVH